MQTKNACGYLRISSNKQSKNNSFDIQKAEIEARANKEGYTIVCWIRDKGVSAYNTDALDRPGIFELLKLIENDNSIEALFFYEESRLDRQIDKFVNGVFKLIKSKKKHFKFFNSKEFEGEWDPNNVQAQINLIAAYSESAVKSKRAKDAQKKLLNNEGISKRPGSRPPFGFNWDIEAKVLEPNEDRTTVVFIFYLAAWGYGDKRIAEILNASSIPSPKGGKWRSSTVDNILNNLSYAGHLAWNVRKSIHNSTRKPIDEIDIFKNNHPPIVPSHFWALIRQLRELKKDYGKFDTSFVFRNLIYCKHCGQQLLTKDMSPAKSTIKYLSYSCPQCKTKINAEKIHDELFKRIGGDLYKQSNEMERYSDKVLISWRNKLTDKIQELNDKLKVIDFNEEQEKKKRKLNAKLPKFEKIYLIAKRQIKETKEKVIISLETVTTLLNDEKLKLFYKWFKDMEITNMSNTEKRTIALLFLKRVEIDLEKNEVVNLEYRLTPFIELETTIGQITEFKVQ
ncbi:MAG: recombinase family protein [Bacillota bacterium]|nr:recombinase family protein [Bacillota bacterium]